MPRIYDGAWFPPLFLVNRRVHMQSVACDQELYGTVELQQTDKISADYSIALQVRAALLKLYYFCFCCEENTFMKWSVMAKSNCSTKLDLYV